ncbi:MAG: serine hydrolase, partial [Acidobacteriota bacterium]|nr:serine hydrolase [Acidobacteriota bacterium]
MTRSIQAFRLAAAVLAAAFLSLGLVACAQSRADVPMQGPRDLARVAPEEVGMSSERLERLNEAMQGLVDEGLLSGITTMISRHGKIAHFGTFGHRDIEAGAEMTEDVIFRIYSMTKPITGVALMVEDGPNGQPITEPADHPMTIRELMAHTAGLSYGIFSQSQVDTLYNEANVLDNDSTLKDMIDKLSKIPLRQQPGSMWHYSVAVDVQGYLVEVLSGQRFDEFLNERLFGPLGMNDTAFHVADDKAHRFAQVYTHDADGNLLAREGFGGRRNYLEPPNFLSGGGGLVSTTMDYMRFSQMLLNGGELDGVRILAPSTVRLMHLNHLPRELKEMSPGTGFGLDFAVVLDPVAA